MSVYIISYDLHPSASHASEAEEYDALFTAFENVGTGYWDCLESTWLIITEKTAAQIADELKPHLTEGDRLLVMRYEQDAAWLGFKDECLTWLKDNL
jgi:hypothetical protein